MTAARRLRHLHNKAMEYSTEAKFAKSICADPEPFRQLALDYEVRAADMLRDRHDCEPTRAVLHRSAAWLAIDAGDYDRAVRLAEEGLRGRQLPAWCRAELNEVRDAAMEVLVCH